LIHSDTCLTRFARGRAAGNAPASLLDAAEEQIMTPNRSKSGNALANILAKRLGILAAALSVMVFARASWGGNEIYFTGQPATSAPFSASLPLPQFNSVVGTLTDVTITYSATITPVLQAQNPVGAAGGGTFDNGTTTLPVDFTGPAGYDAAFSATEGPISGTVPASGLMDFAGAATTPPSIVDTVLPADFSTFVGTGDLSFTYATGLQTVGGTVTGGALVFSGAGSASGGEIIDYGYTAVPDPGSMGIMLATAVGFLIRRRMARSQRASCATV
jgi:hypothetical protein